MPQTLWPRIKTSHNNNNYNNKEKKFVGKSKLTKMKRKVVTQDTCNKSFNETRDVLGTFVNKKCPVLMYNIKEIVTLTKEKLSKQNAVHRITGLVTELIESRFDC